MLSISRTEEFKQYISHDFTRYIILITHVFYSNLLERKKYTDLFNYIILHESFIIAHNKMNCNESTYIECNICKMCKRHSSNQKVFSWAVNDFHSLDKYQERNVSM